MGLKAGRPWQPERKGLWVTSARVSPPGNAELAQGFFKALAQKDLEAAATMLAEGVTDDVVPVGILRGRSEVRGFFEQLLRAFPDLAMTVDTVTADEDRAVVQWHSTGCFSGRPFQGLLATGRNVDVRAVDILEFDGGQIRKIVSYYDGAAVARQIGLLPGAGSAIDRALVSVFNGLTFVRRSIGMAARTQRTSDVFRTPA